jgi:hypothetical protein
MLSLAWLQILARLELARLPITPYVIRKKKQFSTCASFMCDGKICVVQFVTPTQP